MFLFVPQLNLIVRATLKPPFGLKLCSKSPQVGTVSVEYGVRKVRPQNRAPIEETCDALYRHGRSFESNYDLHS
jgi:hypothetical protein